MRNNHTGYWAFVVHRLFRLFPAYWLSVAAACAMSATMMRDYSWQQILVNLTMLGGFFGVEDMLGQYWTLRVELTFYVLCVVLFAFGVLQRGTYLLGIAFFLALLQVIGREAQENNVFKLVGETMERLGVRTPAYSSDTQPTHVSSSELPITTVTPAGHPAAAAVRKNRIDDETLLESTSGRSGFPCGVHRGWLNAAA